MGLRSSHFSVALPLALFLASAPLSAQDQPAVGAWRVVADPLAGWHAFGPVMFSVTAVVGVGTGTVDVPETGTDFLLAAIEPGVKAGRASIMYAHWWGFQGGLIARGTLLRFWKDDPARSWLGGELEWVISVLPIGIRVGAFRPTRQVSGPGKTLWLADLSVMY